MNTLRQAGGKKCCLGEEGDLEANDAKSFRGECYSVLARLVPF